MFESVAMRTTRYADPEGPLDPGHLAEAMLYYSNVLLYANRADLRQLLRIMGPDLLLEYLEEGFLRITYLENFLGIVTEAANTVRERHIPKVLEMPHVTLQHFAPEAFVEVVGKSGRGRRLARRFEALATTHRHDPMITSATENDLADASYTLDCVNYLLRLYAPEYPIPEPLVFNIHKDELGYFVDTNIDFVTVNEVYHRRIPATHSSLSPNYILATLVEVNGSLELASAAGGDIATNDAFSGLLERKVQGILNKRSAEQRQLAKFHRYLFQNALALQDVINSGQRTFKELLLLLKKSRKFREWIVTQDHPDKALLDQYISELRGQSWLDRLPAKTVRWGIMTGIGLTLELAGMGVVGTGIGISLSAFDALVLDRLVKGWKPNQFVDDEFAWFLRKDKPSRAG